MVKVSLPSNLSQQFITLQDNRSDINKVLARYLKDQVEAADVVGSSYALLWRAIDDLIMAGGKRVRPYLTTLAYLGCGGRDYHAALPVAASQELLHLSLLIHDDIIDRDYIRYGRDNVASVFRKHYRQLVDDAALADHYANSAAILAGDLLLAASHAWVAQSNFDADIKDRISQLLSKSIFDVAAGELLDAESVLLPPSDVDSLKIAQYKTASYSFVAPLKIGATMAGASQDCMDSLQQIGQDAGIAYQLMDDLLGIFGTQQAIGKPILSDLQEGKRTYLMQQGLQMAQPNERMYLLKVLGSATATSNDLAKVSNILITCGAKQHVELVIEDHKAKALDGLATCPMHPGAVAALKDLITRALKRDR